ncbi:MAG: autotransporter outer membrane beta-barrel domain-containing protein [Chlorobium sp.]|nr:autotransporter outer membrane beta-barrel domain-containing protein [Chlorobium sp.]
MKLKSLFEGWRGFVLHVLILAAVAGVRPSPAGAADWRSLPQPIGTENIPFLVDPALLNAPYAVGKGPWELSTLVTSTKTTVPQFFIRFYNPTALSNASGQEGSWVMRASSVRGLNAQQIRALFALPNTPTMMTLGLSVPGESFYTGLAAPIDGWGEGGGQQFQSSGTPYTIFFNGQSVMDAVLYYPAMASSDNGRALGTYLVSHTPVPYSDMESVFNSLDVLYNPASQELFNSALNSISPERFDHLAVSGYHVVAMQNEAVDDRIDRLVVNRSTSGLWAQAARTVQKCPASGFDGDINGMIIGFDKQSSEKGVSGFSLAWMQGTVDWYDNGGTANTDYYRAAAYSALYLEHVFLQAVVSAGSANGNTRRNINIGTFYLPSAYGPNVSPLSALSRTAKATHKAWDADIALRSGFLLSAGPLKLIPAFDLGYLYQSRYGFTETGAGSLDWTVRAAHSQTVHCQADLRIEREFMFNNHKKITPSLEIDWSYAKRLDAQAVTASLNGWEESVTTSSSPSDSHFFTGTVGVEIMATKELLLHADYSRQVEGDEGQSGFTVALNYSF